MKFLFLLLLPSLSFSQVIKQAGTSAAEQSASTFTATTCLRSPAAGTTFSAGCNSSTNVGVGIASPSYLLDVSGTVRIGTGATPLVQISTSGYTPTLANTTNVAASTPYASVCTRIGNVVSCCGIIDVDVTAAAATVLGFSLPFASNFTAGTDAGGAADAIGENGVYISADSANDRMIWQWTAIGTANTSYSYCFNYPIL